jgi:hypothetical protein
MCEQSVVELRPYYVRAGRKLLWSSQESLCLSNGGGSHQDRRADDRAWTESWMSMNRIDQYPGRGSGNSCRGHKNPVNVTAAAASQLITHRLTEPHVPDPGPVLPM